MAGFTNILNIWETNLYMSIENIILLILVCMCLIVFAKDFKSGIIILFFMSGGLFMWYYRMGWNFTPALVVFLISLVLMALSLYANSKQNEQGAFI